MEPTERAEIELASRRLALWARRAPHGLALASCETWQARQQVEDALAERLQAQGLTLAALELPADQGLTGLLQSYGEQLASCTAEVVSLTGWDLFLLRQAAPVRALHGLAGMRERLVREDRRLIWWFDPYQRDALARHAPDLESWFPVQVELTALCVEPRGVLAGLWNEQASPAGLCWHTELAAARRGVRQAEVSGEAAQRAAALVRWADLLFELDQLERAEALYLWAANCGLPAEHPERVRCLEHLALLYKLSGKLGAARQLYAQVAGIERQVLGADHSEAVRLLFDWATLEVGFCVQTSKALFEAEDAASR